MGFYGKHILPVLTDLAMRNEAARAERAQWVPLAAGEVLEVGAGSGLNFAHYAPRVSRLYALEPSEELRRMAARRAERARVQSSSWQLPRRPSRCPMNPWIPWSRPGRSAPSPIRGERSTRSGECCAGTAG